MRRTILISIVSLLLSATFASQWTPSRAAEVANPVPAGWPKIVSIPKLGVRANVEYINFSRKSDYEAPHNVGNVAWYDAGPRPGDVGHAAIFGHLDSYCCPAVFYHLGLLTPGDLLYVNYPNGKWLTFKVVWNTSFANKDLPLDFIYGLSNQRGVVLLTCGGAFHRDGTGYDRKQVVYARLQYADGHLG